MVRRVYKASVQVNQEDQKNPRQEGMVLVLSFFADAWDTYGWLVHSMIPGTWGSYFSCALWYVCGSGYGICQDCKDACRYYWEKCVEQWWDSLIQYTIACLSSVLVTDELVTAGWKSSFQGGWS